MRKGTKIGVYGRGDEEGIKKLLSQARLPTEDLTSDKLKNFLVAKREDGSVIGTIGVEAYQDMGLLRSLVIDPSCRGKGLGKRLVDELQSFARGKRINTWFLLTTDAGDFFKKLGYEVTCRDLVPPSVAEAEEFKSICPMSAICLFKNL